MNHTESLQLAREQLILSLMVRGVVEFGGSLESRLKAVSLGPWSIGQDEMDGIDERRAAWALEHITTQNLAIALDTALETTIPGRLGIPDPGKRDYFCFVRCLRNAFAHNPYEPRWNLTDPSYRRRYVLPGGWTVDLTARHNTDVEPSDYLYAGGLIRLLEIGRRLIEESNSSA